MTIVLGVVPVSGVEAKSRPTIGVIIFPEKIKEERVDPLSGFMNRISTTQDHVTDAPEYFFHLASSAAESVDDCSLKTDSRYG